MVGTQKQQELATYEARVTGQVQGVGYRAFVRACAVELGVEAVPTNMPDGSVIVRACGEHQALLQLLERLRTGPPHARVEDANVVWA